MISVALVLAMAIISSQKITLVLVPIIFLFLLVLTGLVNNLRWLKNPGVIRFSGICHGNFIINQPRQ
ncbi:MAG: hypothetical protein F6K39_29370 [Okeania sp. SIO3B3]|nr:hypothetical protein [Okeania sp. SIO3B3]